jgi:hypothetical protein
VDHPIGSLYCNLDRRVLVGLKICTMNIEINTDLPRHTCEARKFGNIIVFTCPQCDYVRSWNIATDKFIVTGDQPGVLHEGMSYPVGIDPNQNPN